MAQHVGFSMLDTRDAHSRENNQPGKEQTQHIILVDAHLLLRLALLRVLTAFPQMCIKASLGATQEVFATLDTATTYTVILGPSIAISDCLHLVEQLRKQQTCGGVVGVVMIQHGLQPETVRTLVEQGVHGLLDESASEQDLAQAITAASRGNIFLSHQARGMLAVSMTQTANHLTEREIQVISRLKCGETNFRIAHVLGIKEKTIEKYLTAIYEKLDVHSRTEAILCLQKLHF